MASRETRSVELERAINRAMFGTAFAGLGGIASHVGAPVLAAMMLVNAVVAAVFAVMWFLRAQRPSEAR